MGVTDGVVFWDEYKTVRDERDRLRSDNATLLAERDAHQSMATQALRELDVASRHADALEKLRDTLDAQVQELRKLVDRALVSGTHAPWPTEAAMALAKIAKR